MEVATTADDLHHHVASSDADMVIVDTAGREPTEPNCVELALAEPRGWQTRSRHILLCLPAALRACDTGQFVDQHRLAMPTGLCITKLDLTTSPGALVLASDASKLPVTTLCNGQRVPEDIAPATAGSILDNLVPRQGE